MLRNGKAIKLENMMRGKYIRVIADIYIDGKRLSNSLIQANLSVTYTGKKSLWIGAKNITFL